MLKREALDAVYANPSVDIYRTQLKAIGSPADDLINDIVDRNLTGSEAKIVKAVIKALQAELAKYGETKPTTLLGKIGRFFAKLFS